MKIRDISEDQVAKYWDENSKLWAEHVRKGWDGYREYFNNFIAASYGELNPGEI